MAVFYYLQKAELHMCNKQLACSQESYERLERKGKIGDRRLQILEHLLKYRFLTEEMIRFLLKCSESEDIHAELDVLAEYGLILKQFFVGKVDGEEIKTVTFYSCSAELPRIEGIADIKKTWSWNKEIAINQAMGELAFSQFHIALCNSVPRKAIQAQTHYTVRGKIIDGRYRLKGRKYSLGYSHMIVQPVRDVAADNMDIVRTIGHVCDAYAYSDVKMPWFVLLCENKVQCANLTRRLKIDQKTREAQVFYLLDTDYDLEENPLKVLQTYQFEEDGQRIISETYCIQDWF